MKKYILLILVLVHAGFVMAQRPSEFLQQKETQRKYLLEQIIALQGYIGLVKKGYEIADKGLSIIEKIKKGDFSLHEEFLGSFAVVNPSISDLSEVEQLRNGGHQLELVYHRVQKLFKTGFLNPGEMEYVAKIFAQLQKDNALVEEEVFQITSEGSYQMNDAERLNRLNGLFQDLQERLRFARHFENEISILVLQRAKEKHGLQALQQLYITK